MSKLKNCPFCGSEEGFSYNVDVMEDEGGN